MENSATFAHQAHHYHTARPGYPPELFDWIATQAPGRELVWDVGTGSGQAALALSRCFARVYATDLYPEQLTHAPQHPTRITFEAAPAHIANLPDQSVDAITVATALHWFDFDRFWPEVRRVARPGALFCAWTYVDRITDPEVKALLIDPVREVVEPFWSDGNTLAMDGYAPQAIKIPFELIPMPQFSCDTGWGAHEIAAFLRSWSAHQKARLAGHGDALMRIETEALRALGDGPRQFILPLKTIAARIG